MARTHVVMSEELLEAIDLIAGERGRSRFLEDAAREKLRRLELERAVRETAGVLSAEDYPEWRDRKAIREWVRRERRDTRR